MEFHLLGAGPGPGAQLEDCWYSSPNREVRSQCRFYTRFKNKINICIWECLLNSVILSGFSKIYRKLFLKYPFRTLNLMQWEFSDFLYNSVIVVSLNFLAIVLNWLLSTFCLDSIMLPPDTMHQIWSTYGIITPMKQKYKKTMDFWMLKGETFFLLYFFLFSSLPVFSLSLLPPLISPSSPLSSLSN